MGSFPNGRPNAREQFIGGLKNSYLKTLNTTIIITPPTCSDPFIITCNTPIIQSSNGSDSDVSVVNNLCGSDNLIDGPEAYFLLQLAEEKDVKIKLSDLQNDLELYVLGASCDDRNCIAQAENFGTGDEILLLQNH